MATSSTDAQKTMTLKVPLVAVGDLFKKDADKLTLEQMKTQKREIENEIQRLTSQMDYFDEKIPPRRSD